MGRGRTLRLFKRKTRGSGGDSATSGSIEYSHAVVASGSISLIKTPYSGHVVVVSAKGGSNRDSITCTNAKLNMLADNIDDKIINRQKKNK